LNYNFNSQTTRLDNVEFGKWYAYNSIWSAVGWSPALSIGSGFSDNIFLKVGRSWGLNVVTHPLDRTKCFLIIKEVVK